MVAVRQNTRAAAGVLVVALALFLMCTVSARAADEDGDAGPLPASAQEPVGTGSLDTITGTIAARPDEDVYKICLTGGGTFSATVTGTTIDSQLYLFDAAEKGVYANDDRSSTVVQSTLPAGHSLTPSAAGAYYLAITTFNSDPVSSGGLIFPDIPFAAVHGPTGPGGASPISGWTRTNFDTGPYTISLTGARFCAQPDTSAPEIVLTTPANGAAYLRGDEVVADYSCADEDGGSGLASCSGTLADGAPIDTTTVGDQSFEVVATDNAGNRASVVHSYRVVFGFQGFLSPVANRPGLNSVRAGSSVPVKFSLSGDHGLDILAAGYPRSAPLSCDTTVDVEGGEPTATPGSSRLSYSSDGDRYHYVWQTERAWAGSCRQLLVKLIDGSTHRANFSFR